MLKRVIITKREKGLLLIVKLLVLSRGFLLLSFLFIRGVTFSLAILHESSPLFQHFSILPSRMELGILIIEKDTEKDYDTR